MLYGRSQSEHVLCERSLNEKTRPREPEKGVFGTKVGGLEGKDGRAGRRCCHFDQ